MRLKSKSIIFVISLVCVLFSCCHVLAENVEITSIDRDMIAREIVIQGKATAGSVVTILVTTRSTNDTIEFEDISHRVTAGGQLSVNADGIFSKKFTLDEIDNSDGWFDVKIYSKTDNESHTESFFMPDSSFSIKMCKEFNEASSADVYALTQKYTETYPMLNIDMTDYKYVTEISEMLIAERTALGGAFRNDKTLATTLNYVIGAYNLKYCSLEELPEFIDKYAEYMGIIADEKFDVIKTDVSVLFDTFRTERSAEKTSLLLREATALCSINSALKSEIKSVLERYNDDVFKLDLSAYDKYDEIDISSAMFDNKYSLASSVVADYNSRINELSAGLYKPPVSPGSSVGGSAGSGGNSAGGKNYGVIVDNEYLEAKTNIKNPFKDMANFEWATEYVERLFAEGVINGVDENNFAPERFVTRAEVCKMLGKVLKLETIIGENVFSDVSDEAWYSDYVIKAFDNGLISGYDGKFEPENQILRRDIAVIVARVLKNSGLESETKTYFNDIDYDDLYAKDAISMLNSYGIVSGTGNGAFEPERSVSRAECAKIICLMQDVIGR